MKISCKVALMFGPDGAVASEPRQHLFAAHERRRVLVIKLPEDLTRALALDPGYPRAFEALSPNQKEDLVGWIESASDPTHRRRRVDMAVRSLR